MSINLTTDPVVWDVYESKPTAAKESLLVLRELILEEAESLADVTRVEESLKWNEASFRTNIGSTLRIDWTEKKAAHIAMYFSCQSKLVPSFRICFPHLNLEGNRALYLPLGESWPEDTIRQCIRAALRYKRVKDLPLLGLEEKE